MFQILINYVSIIKKYLSEKKEIRKNGKIKNFDL